MKYSDEVIEDIRFGNDIVDLIGQHTKLKAKGNSYFGLCPFHREKTPSFSVNPDKQLYHCFGCGEAGNIYSFVMNYENYTFIEAIEYLANRINYTLPELTSSSEQVNEITYKKVKLYEIHKLVARHYYENLKTAEGRRALEYFVQRKIAVNIQKKFGIGYSLSNRNDVYLFLKNQNFDDNIIIESGLVLQNKDGKFYDRFHSRVMFPIIDVQSRIIGFGGRIIDESASKNSPKYLNSPDTLIFNKSNNLYGINFARKSKNKEYILSEGYMDVISLHQSGFDNAIGVLGTAFNQNHAKAIKRQTSKLILLFDSDTAGINAALRAIPVLNNEDIKSKVLILKNAKDPDEYIKKFGKKAFDDEILNAKSYISFQIEQKLLEYDLKDTFQKIEFTKDIAKIISSLENSIEKEVFIKEASQITNISFDTILKEVQKFGQDFKINENIKKYHKNNEMKNDKLEQAMKSTLNILATDFNIYQKVKEILDYTEFLDPLYLKLAKIIYDLNEQKKEVQVANLVNYFDDPKEQQKVSKIFISQIDTKNTNLLEKTINDQIKIIKESYINKKLENIEDIESLNYLINKKKSLKNINIKI